MPSLYHRVSGAPRRKQTLDGSRAGAASVPSHHESSRGGQAQPFSDDGSDAVQRPVWFGRAGRENADRAEPGGGRAGGGERPRHAGQRVVQFLGQRAQIFRRHHEDPGRAGVAAEVLGSPGEVDAARRFRFAVPEDARHATQTAEGEPLPRPAPPVVIEPLYSHPHRA